MLSTDKNRYITVITIISDLRHNVQGFTFNKIYTVNEFYMKTS